jgi:hypothetical protein
MEFLAGALLVVSILTSLTVEGIKKLLNGNDLKYSSNVLAAVVSVVMAVAVSYAYLVMNDIAFTTKIGVEIFSLMYLSFLTSTVGYDKVVQMLGQIKLTKN